MSIKNPITFVLGLLEAIVDPDGRAIIGGAIKRFILSDGGTEVLRQELVTGILRSKVQAKRMKKLAETLESLAITKLQEGIAIQEGAHSLELASRETNSNSYGKAAEAMWDTFRKAEGLPEGTTLKDWMTTEGYAEKKDKPVLRIDGRLQ